MAHFSQRNYDADDAINWTATYRWDSDIVTPYAKFVRDPIDERGVRKTQTKAFLMNAELKSE